MQSGEGVASLESLLLSNELCFKVSARTQAISFRDHGRVQEAALVLELRHERVSAPLEGVEWGNRHRPCYGAACMHSTSEHTAVQWRVVIENVATVADQCIACACDARACRICPRRCTCKHCAMRLPQCWCASRLAPQAWHWVLRDACLEIGATQHTQHACKPTCTILSHLNAGYHILSVPQSLLHPWLAFIEL